jgi:hypothetical protein
MLSDTLKLKTEQIIRNRLWRHSISVDREDSTAEEVGDLMEALVEGLRDQAGGKLRAYVVLPEETVDSDFYQAVQEAECPRFPITGSFGSWEEGGSSAPMVFLLADPKLVRRYAERFWGRDRFAIFFSSLEPLEFFSMTRDLVLLRREGRKLIWAPYWNPASFERLLTRSDSRRTNKIFRWIHYYLAEGDGGQEVRVYCRSKEEEQ